MDKELLLQELQNKINSGEISRQEISTLFGVIDSRVVTEEPSNTKHFSVTKMLYVIGAAIVVVGIIIFVNQIWQDIGSFGRILVTLGMGLVFTGIGSVLTKSKPEENIGPVFFAIGGLLIPGGAVVTFFELVSTIKDPAWPFAMIFGIVFLFYLLLNFAHKHVVLTLFSIANGTAFIYLLVNAILGDSLYGYDDVYAYLTMVIGMSYVFLAQSFKDGWNSKLNDSLYSLGSIAFLGAAFSRVFDSVPWQMLYFILVVGGLYLSIYLKSRNVLIFSTLFLIAHVTYITNEYFTDSLGWPISLILLGFVFIGLGYASIKINKKYISS